VSASLATGLSNALSGQLGETGIDFDAAPPAIVGFGNNPYRARPEKRVEHHTWLPPCFA
jgi:hypothetical protein